MSRRKFVPIDPNLLGFKYDIVKPNTKTKDSQEKKSKPQDPVTTCSGCQKQYFILPDSPLFDPNFDRSGCNAEYFESLEYLNPNTECPYCSSSWRSLGWCMITDSVDDDDEESVKIANKALKKYDLEIEAGKKVMKYLQQIN